MNDPPYRRDDRRKEHYAMRRERDVLLLYGAAFREIPRMDDASNHTPRPSSDSTLTALCQLTAIRLGAQRCMISLLEGDRQHILAEATPDFDLSVLPDSHRPTSNTLWLGNVSIPRSWGLCKQVVDVIPDEDLILITNDLSQGSHLPFQYVRTDPHARFYASVGLLSPNGTLVGSLCIFDSKARSGLSKEDIHLFKGLAVTVVGYLETYTARDQYMRAERFTRGLVSFAEGASGLLPSKSEHDRDISGARPFLTDQSPTPLHPTTHHYSPLSAAGSANTAAGVEDLFELDHDVLARSTSPRPRANRTETSRHQSISKLQETILPNESKSMFARAAKLMMNSSNLDGVIILDASVVANGQRRASGGSEGEQDVSSESCHSRSSSSDEVSSAGSGSQQARESSLSSKICDVLGAATSTLGIRVRHGFLLEPDLGRLFHEYPNRKIFTFTADGRSLSLTEESSEMASTTDRRHGPGATPRRRSSYPFQRGPGVVQAMFPDARSVAFVPFWDYERSRWFAGCLCWSNDPYRLLSASADLAYFKIFSHSIMRELSRLDAVSLSEAKTTFVASISHELRSPLHGILGTLEFIKDTPLDSFQTSMLNSLSACGTTLLDTINHVMDFSKLTGCDSKRKGLSSRRLQNSNTIRLSSKPVKGSRHENLAFDFAIATEEVVEAVFSGASYLPVASKLMEAPTSPSDEPPNSVALRKFCFVVLDLSYEEDWVYSFPVGSWRRIVMNLFGNAIKYTGSGFVHVSLRVHRSTGNTDAPTAIILTITDSGSGMSPAFLANHAFQPFSQENTQAPGTGLGLNIVRTIIDSSGGKIDISSEPGIGTKLTVKLALRKPMVSNTRTPERTKYLSSLPRIEGLRVCILHRKVQSLDGRAMSSTEEGLLRFTNALTMTLRKHLKMDVVETTDWSGHDADLVICPELSFDYLASIRHQQTDGRNAPVTIFVAMDALEAATLRSDTRVTNQESIVEIMTQPCGPHKLAFVLCQSLDRFERQGKSNHHKYSAEPVPQPHVYGSTRSLEPVVTLRSPCITASFDAALPTLSVSGQNYCSAGSAITDQADILHQEDTHVSHILITDDNSLNRKLLVAFMRKNSLKYEEATNGLEALKAYQAEVRKFDVILMDMSMPVMDGMSATRAIREFEREGNLPRCSIIALTGLASASAKLEAWSSGIDHFMTKPVNFNALAALLRRESAERQERRRKVRGMDMGPIQEVSSGDVDGGNTTT